MPSGLYATYPGLTAAHNVSQVTATLTLNYRYAIEWGVLAHDHTAQKNAHRYARRRYDANYKSMWRPRDQKVQKHRKTWQSLPHPAGTHYKGQASPDAVDYYTAIVSALYRPDRLSERQPGHFRDIMLEKRALREKVGLVFNCDYGYFKTGKGQPYSYLHNVLTNVDYQQEETARRVQQEQQQAFYANLHATLADDLPF